LAAVEEEEEEEELAAANAAAAAAAVEADLCVFIWALRLLTLSNTLRHPKQHKSIKLLIKQN
jgi:hypothetical protein